MPDLSQCEDIIKSEDVKAIYEKMRHEHVDKVEVQESEGNTAIYEKD